MLPMPSVEQPARITPAMGKRAPLPGKRLLIGCLATDYICHCARSEAIPGPWSILALVAPGHALHGSPGGTRAFGLGGLSRIGAGDLPRNAARPARASASSAITPRAARACGRACGRGG